MKVLMPVLHYYPVIGGLEIWTKNIAELLSKKAEIFVVTGKVKNKKDGKEERQGVKVFRTSLFRLTDLSHSSLVYILTALPFIFFKSFSLVRKEKIDLIHCQGFLSAFLGYLIFKFFRIPYIVTAQSLQSKSWLKKMVYRKAAYCIAASSAIKKYFEEIGCKNIAVIPNGIDLSGFKGLKREPHDGFIVMTVARLEKVKGINYLIEAISRLDLPGRLSLVLIGDGSQRKKLENLAKRLGVKAKFLGEIPNRKIPEQLAQADCFVIPSIKEGFGIVILEAMAAKIPVIGTRVGGILDIIEDGKTGLLAEPADSRKIAEAIQRIYQSPSLREGLVNNAAAELKYYDWQNIAVKVYEIYLKLA